MQTLEDTLEWSNNRIANLLGTHHDTVRKYREELESTCQIDKLDKLEGQDGKSGQIDQFSSIRLDTTRR